MASKAQKQIRNKLPAWHKQAIAFRRMFLTDVFPDDDSYHASRWASWEGRIRQGHDAEEKLIEEVYQKHKDQPSCDPSYDPDEWAGEDYMETCRLTNSMYAALVVGIWSEMEHFLKDVVSLCHKALDKRSKTLQTTRKFCEDSLAGKLPKATQKARLNSCIKALKEIQTEIPYAFDEIKKAIKKAVDVSVDQCPEYIIVDAIRILNNSFKHSSGCYQPESGKSHTHIDKTLLKKWAILDERNEIDYSKLPIKELVIACNGLCVDLLNCVEAQLESKLGGAK